MGKSQATAERFINAFRALPKRQKDQVLVRLARDRQVREDLIDLAIAERRRRENGRPLKEFFSEAERKK